MRSNSEALFAVISPKKTENLAKGVAITSILHTDEHSHIEPVRYGAGSGFFRMLVAPHSPGATAIGRLWGALRAFVRHPLRWLRALTVRDFRQTVPDLALHANARRDDSDEARSRH